MEKPFSAYQGDEPFVFVCYAHDDADGVYPQMRRLHEGGVRMWYDEGISPGTRWSDELARALTKAALVLFFCTPQSVKSKHCQDEVNFALDEERPLLVIQDGAVDLPPGMRLRLGGHQSILKHELSADQFEDKLMSAISRHVTAAPAPERMHTILSPTASPVRASVAVLPFRSLGNEPTIATFAEGLVDELVTELSGPRLATLRRWMANVERLKVASARSTQRYRNTSEDLASIGQSLGVDYLVEGSVRSAGEQIRIALQLIRAKDNEEVWSYTYDQSLADALRAQAEVARHAARYVTESISFDSWSQRTRAWFSDAAAYDYYHRGLRGHRSGQWGSDVDRAAIVANLERALELEPGFLFTYEYLISGYLELMQESMEPAETVAPIDELLMRLNALLGSDADLYSQGYDRAHVATLRARYYLLQLDYVNADQYARQALSGNPNGIRALVAQGQLFLHRERPDEALASFRRSVDAGGGATPSIPILLAQTLRARGQPAAAAKGIESALDLSPGEYGRGQLLIECARACMALGETDRAAQLVDQAWTLCGSSHPEFFPAALASTDRADRARAILQQLEAAGAARRVNPLNLIEGYVALGDVDAAFRWIDRALAARFEPVVRWIHEVAVSFAGVWPTTLTNDPRWKLARAKLPAVSEI